MAYFHSTKQKAEKARPAGAHLNWMAGQSYDVSDPLIRLRMAASSCFFGEPMYYHRDGADKRPSHSMAARLTNEDLEYLRKMLHAQDPQEWRKLTPAELMERAIDEALGADPERTLGEAVRLRKTEHMRTTPQVILVRAAHHPLVRGTGLVRRFAPEIVQRADEPAVGLAYQMWRYGKPIPNALKKAWREALEHFDDYQLAKYRLEGRSLKTVDVVNLVHPKSASVDKLAKGSLRATDRTWEALISSKGSHKNTWQKALKLMGHMALLRNLRNLLEAKVPLSTFVPQLISTARGAQQFPFRYYSAYRAVQPTAPGELLDALEKCMIESLGTLPWFSGKVMSLCDNSGSAQTNMTSSMGSMQVSTIANLTGVLTGMRSKEGWLGVFGDRLERMAIRPKGSIFEQLQQAEFRARTIGQSTENGVWLFWDQALRKREHWDMVFIYSDMQAGHGGLYGTNAREYGAYNWRGTHYIDVAKLITEYRAKVNPQVLVFLVQVAGYQDTLVPEFYDRTYILGGWGEGLLRFAAEMAGLSGTPNN